MRSFSKKEYIIAGVVLLLVILALVLILNRSSKERIYTPEEQEKIEKFTALRTDSEPLTDEEKINKFNSLRK